MEPVIWFVGLSGSGKTTLATKTREFLESHPEIYPDISHWEIIDGDIVRSFLGSEIGYNFEERRKSVMIMGLLAHYLSKNNVGVIVANISPFHDIREKLRREIPGYIEIYCRCTISGCMKRDPKCHYKNQQQNGVRNFIGLDIPFQPPENPDLVINTESDSIVQCMEKISEYFLRL